MGDQFDFQAEMPTEKLVTEVADGNAKHKRIVCRFWLAGECIHDHKVRLLSQPRLRRRFGSRVCRRRRRRHPALPLPFRAPPLAVQVSAPDGPLEDARVPVGRQVPEGRLRL